MTNKNHLIYSDEDMATKFIYIYEIFEDAKERKEIDENEEVIQLDPG